MDLFTYLMAKNDHNTSVNRDLFSYQLGKGQSGTYQEYTGTSLSINNTKSGKMKLSLKGNTEQDGTPTPDSPQPIHSVSGDNTITISNSDNTQSQTLPINLPVENLFDKKGDVYFSGTGIDITYDSDNQEYTLNGTLLTAGNATLSKGDLGISEDEEITISAFHTGGTATIPSGSVNAYAYSIFSQDNTKYIRGKTDNQEFLEKYTFTGNMIAKSGGDSDYVFLQLWRVGTTFDNYKIKIQIEKGSKSNSFTPYGTTPIEMNGIGDYQDYFYKDSGKWYLHKEIGKVVLDGSETDWRYNSNNALFVHNITPIGKFTGVNVVPDIKCNYFIPNTFNKLYSEEADYGISNGSSGADIITIRNKDITSVVNFQTWLLTHNTTVYYVLATPTNTEITNTTLIEQLDNIENAMSYNGQTNISQVNNDLPFNLIVKVKVKS